LQMTYDNLTFPKATDDCPLSDFLDVISFASFPSDNWFCFEGIDPPVSARKKRDAQL